MVAQPGSGALFTGKHSYFESPDKPVSSAVKRARISILEVSQGKGKDRAKQRRGKSDDKYTGTAPDLIAKFKPQYTDDEWSQREKLIQSGVAINLDGNPHASLFVKDRTEDATGRNRFICVKCRRFGHTAPFCDDLKRAQSWKQCSEGSK